MDTVHVIIRAEKKQNGEWEKSVYKECADRATADIFFASLKRGVPGTQEDMEYRVKHPLHTRDILNVERTHPSWKSWECFESFTIQKHKVC